MKKFLQPSNHHEAHSFNPNVALLVGGIEKAILLKDIYGLCNHKLKHKELTNGIPFAYFSSRALSEKYVYMNEASIRRWMIDLEKDGWVISTISNKMKLDKTKSYFANFEKYDLATLNKSQDEKDLLEWKQFVNSSKSTIVQNEQSFVQNEQSIVQDEQRSVQNKRTITYSTNLQPFLQQELAPNGSVPFLSLDEMNDLEAQLNDQPSEAHKAPPVPPPPPLCESCEADVTEILLKLNELAGTNIVIEGKRAKNNREAVKKLFKNEYSKDEIIAVVQTKCFEWLNNPEMVHYLRPSTLFGNKFQMYLDQYNNLKSNPHLAEQFKKKINASKPTNTPFDNAQQIADSVARLRAEGY